MTTKTRKPAAMTDCRGITLEAANTLMASWKDKLGYWPQLHTHKSPSVLATFHQDFNSCWLCAAYGISAHHICSGNGRSDERCNLAAVCRECHDKIHASKISLGDVLRAKHKFDKDNLDWFRLVWLKKAFITLE